MKIANQYQAPLYPISTGKNWGYGSRAPAQDGCVTLDLSRLNRITAFDEDLAYVTLEPGVTQQQLYDFLQNQGSNLFFSTTGSSPHSSLIGNVLERGQGEGPYGDRFEYTSGFEVVLPTGEFIQTGFGRFSGAKATPINKWGVGPYLDGLFTQSNLGIVTQMTLWLTPKPDDFQIIWYSIDQDEQLEALVDAIRRLKLLGIVRGGFVIANDLRMLSYHQQYPWDEMDKSTPLSTDLRHSLNQKWGDGKWSGEAAIYSPNQEHGDAVRRIIEDTLRPIVDKLYIFDDEMEKLSVDDFQQKYPILDRGDTLRWYKENLKRGIPNEFSMTMTYWRKDTTWPDKNLDPDRDQCGLLWCSPAVPFSGDNVREVVTIVEAVALAYHFECSIGLNCITERNITSTVAIVYDREVSGEDERAMQCYKAMVEKLGQSGYIPYRLGVQSSMSDLPTLQDDSQQVIHRLKQVLDPNNILAPGRYDDVLTNI